MFRHFCLRFTQDFTKSYKSDKLYIVFDQLGSFLSDLYKKGVFLLRTCYFCMPDCWCVAQLFLVIVLTTFFWHAYVLMLSFVWFLLGKGTNADIRPLASIWTTLRFQRQFFTDLKWVLVWLKMAPRLLGHKFSLERGLCASGFGLNNRCSCWWCL